MKKILSITAIVFLVATTAAWGQNPCNIFISGDSDMQCVFDFKDVQYDEYPTMMGVCQNSRITYTAMVDDNMSVSSYNWEVMGDLSHNVHDNQVTVDWGGGEYGILVVTVVTDDGTVCTASAYVKLIAAPTAASITVPAYTINSNGEKEIVVCQGTQVVFLDNSVAEGSDISGQLWESASGASSATPSYTIEAQVDDVVSHTVINNCGCFDRESIKITVIKGDILKLNCYGTVCEGAVVTYGATEPTCLQYNWHVDGGTLIDGQNTPNPTVQWNSPQDGYGVLSLDGVVCGEDVCPALLSVKIPIIQDSLVIEGPHDVCLGESAVFHLPLFGSTKYKWSVNPSATEQSDMANTNEIRLTFPSAGIYHISASYQCDFLGCGPLYSREFDVAVLPSLKIEGQDQICRTNNCNLSTVPAVAATWQAYDMGNGNSPVGSATTGTSFVSSFSNPGHYLIAADHPDYCGPATFILIVKDVPPPPSAADLSPDNLHTACSNGGITLTGTPSEASYNLVWAPACTTATPSIYTGDSVTILYGNQVCDVNVYNYDRILQCQSTSCYVHTVTQLNPAATTLPSSITVCPNSMIHFTDSDVPDQSADGMTYEWRMEELQQHRATVVGSHQQNNATFVINSLDNATSLPFYIELDRYFCGTSDAHTINIFVRDDLASPLTISGPDIVCIGTANTYTYSWLPSGSASTSCTFYNEGTEYLVLHHNPYDFCDDADLYSSGSKTVTVILPPEAQITYDDATTTLSVSVSNGSGSYSYTWYYIDDYGVAASAPLGSGSSVVANAMGYYDCAVVDLNTTCTTTVSYHLSPPVPPCSSMTLNHGSFDYCSHSITFSSPQNTIPVVWSVSGGDYVLETSGPHNNIADVTVENLGTFTVCAQATGPMGCYRGCYSFDVNFLPDFYFVSKCNKVNILNKSKYVNGLLDLFFTVTNDCNNTVDYISFPAGSTSYDYIPSQPSLFGCTYTFQLTGYGTNGNISNCVVGSADIGFVPVLGDPVSITLGNPYFPNNTCCNNTPIQLTASLNYPDATVSSSSWSFDDGSSLNTPGNSVYHTFRNQNDDYHVSVTVVDSRGCQRSILTPIQIHSSLNPLVNGSLTSTGNQTCPRDIDNPRTIVFQPNSTGNHYTWSAPLTGTGYQNYVSEPDVYSVNVVNTNYCHKKASTYVPFSNCPTARIYAESFTCCIGQEMRLYGSMEPATGMQYQWTVTSSSESLSFTTGDIVFTPSVAGTYNVTLTVTDGITTCSSTAHAVVTVVAQPPAPVLYFPDDSCINNAPITVAASGYSGIVHWSNGATGITTPIYSPGIVSAYYYDPAIGCPSKSRSILIAHQPDFDALLTGCYEKCKYGISPALPVYALTPDTIDWTWYYNNVLSASASGSTMPLALPLAGFGSYRLAADYQHGGCHDSSPVLTISEKTTCDCDSIQVLVKNITIDIVECELHYVVTLDVYNESHRNLCISDMDVVSVANNVSIMADNCSGHTVNAGTVETLSLALVVSGLAPSSVLIQLYDDRCLSCTKQFSIDLTPDVACHSQSSYAALNPIVGLSNEAAVYADFSMSVPKECHLLACWAEPDMVLNYTYDDNGGYVDGIAMFSTAQLSQMAENEDNVVCIHALICCNDELCVYTHCVSVADIFDRVLRSSQDQSDDQMSYALLHKDGDGTLSLAGNPTTGDVSIVGNSNDIRSIQVLDMHGRQVAQFTETRTFNVTALPAGTYIVHITIQPDVTGRTMHHYLKLIKK